MDEETDADERTLYCGNLSDKVTEEILYELFHQAGPVEKVYIRSEQGRHYNYGFVTYRHACSCEYAIGIFQNTKLYGKTLNMKKRTRLNSNGQHGNDMVLQQPNSLLHASNLQFMMPQHLQPVYMDHYPGQELYYSTPGRYNRNSPPRRSPPPYHSSRDDHRSSRNDHRSSRNDHRSHKHYDEPKSSHGHNHGHDRHRKRHKR